MWFIDPEKHAKEIIEKGKTYIKELEEVYQSSVHERPEYYLDKLTDLIEDYLKKEYMEVQRYKKLEDIEVRYCMDYNDNGEPEGAYLFVFFHVKDSRGKYTLLLYQAYWTIEELLEERPIKGLFITVDNNLLAIPESCLE